MGLRISMISQATADNKFWIKTWEICFDTMIDIGVSDRNDVRHWAKVLFQF